MADASKHQSVREREKTSCAPLIKPLAPVQISIPSYSHAEETFTVQPKTRRNLQSSCDEASRAVSLLT